MSENSNNEFLIEEVPEGGEAAETSVPNTDSISYDPDKHLSFTEIKKLSHSYILPTYSPMPVAFQYGAGEYLFDSEGNEYLDFLSGIAVISVGHAQSDIVDRLSRQADLLWHTSNLFYNQQQAMLARAIVEITFPGKVFFCNSGTEANEAAFKMMRAHGQLTSPAKTKILALKKSFHGRSMASLSMTGQSKIQDGFGPILQDVVFIDANDRDALVAEFDDTVCGFIAEPIQGEAGVLPIDKEFLAVARELCDQHQAIMVLDEIQTGVGRTGNYFAYQGLGVMPDVITMAKGLGGGFPIGAVMVAEKYTSVLAAGMHGSTFGGNHLACAVAYEVLRVIESNRLLDNVKKMSSYLIAGLETLQKKHSQKILAIRGLGLLIGLELPKNIKARDIVKQALEQRLVIGRAGDNVLRFAPPLSVRAVTIDSFLERLDTLITAL